GHLVVPAPNKEAIRKLPNGMKIYSPAGFRGIRGYVTGVYEEDLMLLVKSIIGKGLNVVDLGALIGLYTLTFSDLVGSNGQVYSFEPEPITADFLRKNVKINECTNVIIVQKAVADRIGSSRFITSKSKSIGPVGGILDSNESNGSLTVDTITLDKYFYELGWPTIDLIKMDIDGAEFLALEGMKELSRHNQELKLIMEFDPHWSSNAWSSPQKMIELLLELGFKRGRIVERRLKAFELSNGFPTIKNHFNILLEKLS
ncbi:unnamed protein product, partial [marine sediment metagenome]